MNEAEFKSPLGAKEELLFWRLYAREELGRLPEFRVDLLRSTKLTALEAKQLLGKTAAVTISPHDGKPRHLHGYITQFERGGVHGSHDIYRVVLRPWLWQLTLTSDCRVFQDVTVDKILKDIFKEHVSGLDIEDKLKGPFRTRPYTVQYRESDYSFVARLMEEEGIYYYFKHEEGNHKLVLCNGPDGHSPVPGGTLKYTPSLKSEKYTEAVIDQWSRAHLLQSLHYTHTDYAAEAPTTDLVASAKRDPMPPYPEPKASAQKPNGWEVFEYPGGHDDYAMGTNTGTKEKLGKDLAKVEIDRMESMHCVATATTPYRLLAVGHTFKFDGHLDKDDYLVTSSVTEMEYNGYEADHDEQQDDNNYICRFNAVPKKVLFQPEAEQRQPVIRGPQTALVVGPVGDEIHTDKYGRIKVLFHWDRIGKKEKKNEKSSCWVRVAHPWASKGFGMVTLPRIGDEVVVEFLEGNPDRPLITGSVYNGTNKHPYDLPAHATVSGIRSRSSKKGSETNFNELRFEDEKGKEYVWFQAEKDFHQLVKADAYQSVGGDLSVDVGNDVQHQIGGNFTASVGKMTTIDVKGDTHVKLEADLRTEVVGAFSLIVDGNLLALVEGSSIQEVAGTMGLLSKAAINLTAETAVNIKASTGVVIDGGTSLCIKAGSGFILLDPSGVTIVGPVVKINSGGSAGSADSVPHTPAPIPKVPGPPKGNKDPLAGEGGQ